MIRVIFACVHNAGRSQMAAAFFNSMADPERARAISAGTAPAARVHPEVIHAMREVGIDLSHAVPALLTDALAADAQRLVTMGCGEACPVVPGLRREDWPLADPKGQSLERVRGIRDDIQARVRRLLEDEGWSPTQRGSGGGENRDPPVHTARMNVRQRVLLLLSICGFLLIGRMFFGSLSIGASADAVRDFVRGAGWWGPATFILLFLFRSVLLLPSVVLLTAGGVCFGVVGGAVFGALGLLFSATVKFVIAHVAGREKLIARLPARWREQLRVIDSRISAGTLGLVTAYPIGPAEIIHIGAILSGMAAVPFLTSVATGSLVRAASFSLFGDAITKGRGLTLAAIVLTASALLPLAVPAFRRALRPPQRQSDSGHDQAMQSP